MYLEFVLIECAKMVDMETSASKKSLLPIVLKRRGHTTPRGATWESTGVSQEAWARVLMVVFAGKNGKDRVGKLNKVRIE